MFTYANVGYGHFTGTWNAAGLGALQEVRPNMRMLWEAIRINSVGRMQLSKRFAGLDDEAAITLVMAETAIAQLRAMVPWDNGSGTVDLTPPIDTDLYQYAQQMVLHPTDAGAATDKDLRVFKTVPVHGLPWAKNQKGQTFHEVTFLVLPDHAKLVAGTPAYFELVGA